MKIYLSSGKQIWWLNEGENLISWNLSGGFELIVFYYKYIVQSYTQFLFLYFWVFCAPRNHFSGCSDKMRETERYYLVEFCTSLRATRSCHANGYRNFKRSWRVREGESGARRALLDFEDDLDMITKFSPLWLVEIVLQSKLNRWYDWNSNNFFYRPVDSLICTSENRTTLSKSQNLFFIS